MRKENPKINGDEVVDENGKVIGIVSHDGSLDYTVREKEDGKDEEKEKDEE